MQKVLGVQKLAFVVLRLRRDKVCRALRNPPLSVSLSEPSRQNKIPQCKKKRTATRAVPTRPLILLGYN